MDEHKSYEQLRKELAEAATRILVGQLYAHYKHLDKPYKILGFVVWEATDQIAVLYQPIDKPDVTFARPVNVWLETVEWEGRTLPRFAKVEQ